MALKHLLTLLFHLKFIFLFRCSFSTRPDSILGLSAGELGNSGLGLPSKSDPTGMIFFFCPLGVSLSSKNKKMKIYVTFNWAIWKVLGAFLNAPPLIDHHQSKNTKDEKISKSWMMVPILDPPEPWILDESSRGARIFANFCAFCVENVQKGTFLWEKTLGYLR